MATLKKLHTITAGELRDALKMVPDDAPVVFVSNYGNHCRTQQVHTIDGAIAEQPIKESAYSVSGWALDEDRDFEPEEPGDEAQQVFVIE